MESRKNSLGKNGLSMSQAQTISNICNQLCVDIQRKIDSVNNYSRHIVQKNKDNSYDNDLMYCIQNGVSMPEDIKLLIDKKCKYHACQAFLMENIKRKAALLNEIKTSKFDDSVIEKPIQPTLELPKYVSTVDEEFGWAQLSIEELNQYINAEAYASHIGKFIHSNGKLTLLREELPLINDVDFIDINLNEKTIVKNVKHHNADELMRLHEHFANLHKEYEQKVNYYKATVKNITTTENARICKINADEKNKVDLINKDRLAKYESDLYEYNNKIASLKNDFEINRQERIKEVSAYRIIIDPLFQKVIDELNVLEK